MAGRFSVDRAARARAGRGLMTRSRAEGLECDEEADTVRGVPGLGRPGLQAGSGPAQRVPGRSGARWSPGARPLVPDGPRLLCGPGIAAMVRAGPEDHLTDAAGGPSRGRRIAKSGRAGISVSPRGFAPITR